MSSKLTISILLPRNFGNNGIIVLLFVFNVRFILKPFIRNVELSERLYRIDTLFSGSLTSHLGYLGSLAR